MTSSNGNIFRVTGPLCGIQRSPVNSPHKGQWRGSLMFSLICALNRRLSKQSRGWWFETPSRPLWRHCNEEIQYEGTTCGHTCACVYIALHLQALAVHLQLVIMVITKPDWLLGPIYLHGLTFISPWISNYTHYLSVPKLQWRNRWRLKMGKRFHSTI